jgi:S-formylglutathione hydrolase FrmB
MKTNFFYLLVTGIFLFISCHEQPEIPGEDFRISEKSAEASAGTVVTESIHSNALQNNLLGMSVDREVKIYLPKSYYTCPEKRFPVIYFLHGMPAWSKMLMELTPFENFEQFANLQAPVDFPNEAFTEWVNNLIDDGGMREAIIVMPDAKTFFGPNVYQNSEVLGNSEDYIVEDVVSYIDSHFRTIAHFNWRAISGHCAGGYGALNIAMKHPHVFRYVGALSPAHFPEETMLLMASIMPQEDALWGEYGVPAGPVPYYPMNPVYKFASGTAYALAQAWLPNPDNPPYLCDLPFEYVEGHPVIIPDRMDKINMQSLFGLTRVNRIGLKQLKTLYFDCGEYDDLGMFQPNVMLHEQLVEMKIKHEFKTYPGTHISHLYERLGKVWTELSNDFPEED